MKIGIDISMLVYRGSGVATYTFNLVKNLLKIDKKNTYLLFYSSFRRPENFTYLDELKKLGGIVVDYPFPPRILKLFWNKWNIIPVELFTGKVDIFHSSDFLRPPLLHGTLGVTTIHDLTWKKYPQFHTNDIVEAHTKKLELTIKNKDVIIVDAKKTREDLFHYYPDIKNDIHIVPLGVDEKYFRKHDKKNIDEVLLKYKITTPYFLYVGAIEPRKNIPTLIESFDKVLQEFPDMHLVLAGRAGWKNEEVFSLVKKLNIEQKVATTGYIDDADLPMLYQGAKVFVYPSLYEGFGLPPLEAIASGTPTIAYNSPSINSPFVTSISPQELSKRITEYIKKPILNEIKIPTWEETAKKTLSIYQHLLV